MAEEKKTEKVEKKEKKDSGGKKKKKNKLTSKKYLMYKITGDKIERREHCPRCGPGIFLAKTKNGVHCGKCHYAEMKKVIT